MNGYGYGFSIWLVPYNWRHIKKEFTLDFIPHITLSTNHRTIPEIPILENIKVGNFTKGKIFKQIYAIDPLEAYGYDCEILSDIGINIKHVPHMTLFYGGKITDENMDYFSLIKKPPKSILCFCTLANTISLNPASWHFL